MSQNEQKEFKPQLTCLTQPTFLNVDSHLCGFLSLSTNELWVEETQSTQACPWGPVQLLGTHTHIHAYTHSYKGTHTHTNTHAAISFTLCMKTHFGLTRSEVT